jgi:hypothetical protein
MRFAAMVCLTGLLGTGSAAAQPAGWNLAALMQSMAQIRSSTASFTERKTLPMLSAPLQASGTLAYVAPDTIRKTTFAPMREDFVLTQNEITLTGGPGNQTHRFSLRQDPEIGGLAEGIRGTLAGDLPGLQRLYGLSLSGSEANWQLVLKPIDPALAHFVTWIAIRGDGNRITGIDTAGGDGSRSVMTISEDRLDAR